MHGHPLAVGQRQYQACPIPLPKYASNQLAVGVPPLVAFLICYCILLTVLTANTPRDPRGPKSVFAAAGDRQ
jgi:hypothetical protein